MMLISELKKIIEETIQNYKLGNTDINTIPLILCGDLNSLPDSGKYSRHSDNVSLTLIYFLIQVKTIDIVIIPPKPEFTSWFR
jgi:endonuclease/exonuclease/phosphatase family metal-dependent hydrolase